MGIGWARLREYFRPKPISPIAVARKHELTGCGVALLVFAAWIYMLGCAAVVTIGMLP